MPDLRDELFYKPKNAFDQIDEAERKAADDYCVRYMDFLSKAKTEREAVTEGIRLAKAAGFREYAGEDGIHPGDKIYRSVRGKALMLAVIGKLPMS